MSRITNIHAREVLDSRGKPTVEAEVTLKSGWGCAIVPSGASTGRHEACELRDGDPMRYDGQGVLKAVANVNSELAEALVGTDASDQAALDARLIELDGTPQKTRLGANALLAVSLAVARAAADADKTPLYEHLAKLYSAATGREVKPTIPLPMINMISGGAHAGGNLDFQDVMIVPWGAANYAMSLEWTVRVYRRLQQLLSDAGYEANLVGDEGGYGPRLKSNREAIEMVVRAIEAAGLSPGRDVSITLDVAATQFYDGTHYHLQAESGERLSGEELTGRLVELANEFPIISIEDPLAEDDWPAWQGLMRRLGDRVRVVGDDLLVTNAAHVQRAAETRSANSVLVKVNQIGTLSETFETMRVAEAAGFTRIVSARSGETEDSTIADLAVGTTADHIKIGSIVRSERLAKYNRLLRIEEELGSSGWK
jgi:enolase